MLAHSLEQQGEKPNGEFLRQQAERYRALARSFRRASAMKMLQNLARDCDAIAAALESADRR